MNEARTGKVKRIKLDSRSLAEKSRKAPVNDDAPRNDEQELIIIITRGTCNYPSAWNHRREDRERRASHTRLVVFAAFRSSTA